MAWFVYSFQSDSGSICKFDDLQHLKMFLFIFANANQDNKFRSSNVSSTWSRTLLIKKNNEQIEASFLGGCHGNTSALHQR